MDAQLQSETEKTFKGLYHALAPLSEQQVNTVPFAGSWTAGQVTEHIIKSAGGLNHVCGGPGIAVDRAQDEKVKAIRDLFLDFSVKFQAPDFIVPCNGPHNKEELLTSLRQVEQEIGQLAATTDLSPECALFELPGFGKLTKFELLSFVLIHAQRHTRQLENISRHLMS
ncbi:DinB family protein [Taibaiella chishuiensis]|uniref:DinB family protein n=1 Tax=Taibaiella chishuiensis TaxID=1434707 RepID=A0A2P8D4H1_9BACT|nr:DinB family protein [Taibaiella chishuiensis]PSK92117.1 DinB family protein [Taibaiella chishuiensis]